MSMIHQTPTSGIYVGVDTHARTHHAAVIDQHGRELGDRQFTADQRGYESLMAWAESFGPVQITAVEGTHSYGAGLTRVLLAAKWQVRETAPGDKVDRRRRGKSDAADAFTAARAALSGRASALPKTGDGTAEMIRILRTNRSLLVRQQTQLMNQIKALLITGPDTLRTTYAKLTRLQLARRLAATPATTDPTTSVLLDVLCDNAQRWLDLRDRAKTLERQIHQLVRQHRPELLTRPGVGPDTAARLIASVSDHPDRIGNEAQMAHLFGLAPIQASSGNTHRHRLDRGGDRSANTAIHRIALTRARTDPTTRDYLARCQARGKTHREAIRLLKRHLVRELYPLLTT